MFLAWKGWEGKRLESWRWSWSRLPAIPPCLAVGVQGCFFPAAHPRQCSDDNAGIIPNRIMLLRQCIGLVPLSCCCQTLIDSIEAFPTSKAWDPQELAGSINQDFSQIGFDTKVNVQQSQTDARQKRLRVVWQRYRRRLKNRPFSCDWDWKASIFMWFWSKSLHFDQKALSIALFRVIGTKDTGAGFFQIIISIKISFTYL